MRSTVQKSIYDEICAMPVVDCHQHVQGPAMLQRFEEPIAALVQFYANSDLVSAAFDVPDREIARLQDNSVSTDLKWPLFSTLWERIRYTAYARVTRRFLKSLYGVDEPTREGLEVIREKLASRDEAWYYATLRNAGIEVMITDVLQWVPGGTRAFVRGEVTFPEIIKPMISLPVFHPTTFNAGTIDYAASIVERTIASLDDYLEATFDIFRRCVERGAIGFKDQSAYQRTLHYEMPTRSEAEGQFNRVLSDRRAILGWPDGKQLNDYLFHHFMRCAAELDLPVQLHTGHMAGIRSRVDEANALHLRSLLEVHKNVRFDLFHGNWPYMDDLLFLGKNYPNVSLDLCWAHIIDPDFSVELLSRALKTTAHSKIHGFGGDYPDLPEYIVGHLDVARENVARALAQAVETGWIVEDEAVAIARGYMYENPRRYFRLET